MFGLLRFRKNCSRNDAWKQWRLHYCGTCKTMGKTYGQASRMLLNHDTVYLAEVLTALDPKPIEWDAPFRSFNCFALPEKESPAALRFAAAATVALAEYKLRDQVEDSRQSPKLRMWRMAKRWWSPRFRRAVRELQSLGFDAAALDRALTSQQQIEYTATASLEDLAKPTATAVSLFFAHGASIVGRRELGPQMAEFGASLGTLVYLLDAFEDQARDTRNREFNALSSLGLTRQDAIAELDRLVARAIETLRGIDLGPSAAFASRLRANLDPRLGRSLTGVCCAPSSAPKPRWTWTARWGAAWDRAESLAEGRKWPVLAAVAVSVFVFPEHAKSAESAGECMSLGANLMALGSIFAVAIGRKKKIAAAAGAVAAGDAAASGGGGWGCGNCCSSSVCDGCDCCCDCGDCCSSCGECGGCCDC